MRRDRVGWPFAGTVWPPRKEIDLRRKTSSTFVEPSLRDGEGNRRNDARRLHDCDRTREAAAATVRSCSLRSAAHKSVRCLICVPTCLLARTEYCSVDSDVLVPTLSVPEVRPAAELCLTSNGALLLPPEENSYRGPGN